MNIESESEKIIIEFIDNDQNVAHSTVEEVSSIDPFSFELNDFLPNEKPLTLDRFFNLASQVIENAQKSSGIKDNQIVKLIEEYPPENFHDLGNEVISFRLIERKPGMMDKKGKSRPQRKHRFCYEYTGRRTND